MKKIKKPDWISQEDWDSVDSPPMTKKQLARMRPAHEVVPQLVAAYRRKRAAKGQAGKRAVSIRLSPEVIAFYKARGAGWQTRIDDTLKAIVQSLQG
ncbi:MAG: hypothetical protein EBZ69_07595 [Alphaproteobacteria bacterium]|nr:hypothetical protein [Alphaproteobacteria bacterium]NDC56652.1 hypothetical protein [Alphaproteobacteria bacterium]NDG04244.1 hypothetical protein [Alphaproteobacteria bacterium]